jgi:hypothetical protein
MHARSHATVREDVMHEIRVNVTSTEEALDGTAELWYSGELIAFTRYDDGDLMLQIEPRRDGAAVVVGARAMATAIAEIDRRLGEY